MPHAGLDSPSTLGPVSIDETGSPSDWDEYVSSHAGGTFYHLHSWSQINREQLGHTSRMLRARHAGRLAGILPLTLVSSPFFGRILCSMPFVNYGGPCAHSPAIASSLADAARELARETNAGYLELRCAAPLQTELPASTRKVSMTLALQADAEKLFEKYASKHRTTIRRSFKNGLSVSSGGRELLPTFYSVMEQSWRSLGTPLYSRRYFEAIVDTFPEHTRIFVCSRGAEPVAVAFNGEFNGTIEGMWAGGTAASRGLQANYALYWEMIQDACRRGFQRFHLGRSTADSGAEDFKRKWNADTLQLHWYHHRPDGGAQPELNVDNPKYRLAINLWRRMPLWMTRLAGPPIARGIP